MVFTPQGFRESYRVLGIESESAMYKASALPSSLPSLHLFALFLEYTWQCSDLTNALYSGIIPAGLRRSCIVPGTEFTFAACKTSTLSAFYHSGSLSFSLCKLLRDCNKCKFLLFLLWPCPVVLGGLYVLGMKPGVLAYKICALVLCAISQVLNTKLLGNLYFWSRWNGIWIGSSYYIELLTLPVNLWWPHQCSNTLFMW